MKAQETQHIPVQNDRNYQQRPGFQGLRKKFQCFIFGFRNVIDPDRFAYIKPLGELFGVKGYRRTLAFWNKFVLSPLVTDDEVPAFSELQQITPVSVEHLPDL